MITPRVNRGVYYCEVLIMFDTIISKLSAKIKRYKNKVSKAINPIKVVILIYTIMTVCIVSTYYIAWIMMWCAGKEGLASLLSLLKECTSPAVIGFITFVALSMVDSDGDGIPDSIDKVDDRKENKEEPSRKDFSGRKQ